jgi:hypothetical protein
MSGKFTIPTLVFLTPEQRDKLEHLLDVGELELSELLSELLAQYLAAQPEAPSPAQPVAAQQGNAQALRQRRAELRRLRARMELSDGPPAAWLTQYLADLEADIRRLEQG